MVEIDGVITYWPPDHAPHKVTEPYVRWGSSYACVDCVARFEPGSLSSEPPQENTSGGGE